MANHANAQVGINNTDPQSSLDVTASNSATPANTDGILIPRIDALPSTNPGADQHSLLVFLTTADGLDLPGFYYWDNTQTDWVTISVPLRINDLVDGKSDYDGSDNGSSIFLGLNAGANDNGTHNQNIGIGYNSLNALTTNVGNVGVGYNTLSVNTANNNTAVGNTTMQATTTGQNNTAIGQGALRSNTTGGSNVALGAVALRDNVGGANNLAIGRSSLLNNISGNNNVAVGNYTLLNNTATGNTAIGGSALNANTSGENLVAVGASALGYNTIGDNNVGIGEGTLQRNTTGNANLAIGTRALQNMDGSDENTAVGNNAAINATGARNSFYGHQAGYDSTGDQNTFIGLSAGYNSTGDNNVYLGHNAGFFNTTGTGNVFIGYLAGENTGTDSNQLRIENSQDNTSLIYGEFAAGANGLVGINWDPASDGTPPDELAVNGDASKSNGGGNWNNHSDRRLKRDITTLSTCKALDLVSQLRGVTYYWNDTQTGLKRDTHLQYGFVAQELKEIFPDHVSTDSKGFYQTAYGNYDALFVQAIKELKQQLAEKTKENEQLQARLELIEAKLGLKPETEKVVLLED
ncbi:hypothetical protein KH5_15420 [Urechidicola sp. KH5]